MNVDFTKPNHAEQFVKDNTTFSLQYPPTASLELLQFLISDLTQYGKNHPGLRYQGIEIGQALIRATQRLLAHSEKVGFIMVTKIKSPRSHEILQVFGGIPKDKREKYEIFAKGKAGLIYHGSKVFTSKTVSFDFQGESHMVKGGVQLTPGRGTAISGLSPDGERDEMGATIMDFANPGYRGKKEGANKQDDTQLPGMKFILSNNRYAALLLALMYFDKEF